MNGRNKAARILVALGALVFIAAAFIHLSDYTKDMSVVSASNLSVSMQNEVRSLFLLVGWHWLVVAITMLIGAFIMKELPKLIVLCCGLALLVTLAVILGYMGWFWGCAVILSSALLVFCGGLLYQNPAGIGKA
jgi:hypothetical protein